MWGRKKKPMGEVPIAGIRIENKIAKYYSENEIKQIKEKLKDPDVVHVMMLRGSIAKLDKEKIKHIYPVFQQMEDLLCLSIWAVNESVNSKKGKMTKVTKDYWKKLDDLELVYGDLRSSTDK